jgi:hypothetical protein
MRKSIVDETATSSYNLGSSHIAQIEEYIMDGTTLFCILIPIILIVVIFFVASQKRNALEQASAAYQDSLRELKTKPTNADLKQQTLALGRQYSNLTRNRRGVTVYDEMALMNDINAATASATHAPSASSTPSAAPKPVSIEDRLKQLDALKTKGLLSDEEFTTRRQKILEDL